MNLSPDTCKTLIWFIVMLLIDYAAVVLAVIIDLRSAIRRARRLGAPLSSKGYRRSVDKCLRYMLTMLAFSAIDAMIVAGAMLFRSTMGWSVPVFPLCTTICGLLLALIEGKSVMENSQRRADFTQAIQSAVSLLSDRQLTALLDAIRALRAK